MDLNNIFQKVYYNKKVLITGHTGFKGSWLALWLLNLGAEVIGYSLKPPSSPNHFDLLNLPLVSIHGDILDFGNLGEAINKYKPEILFHMAAQPLVRYSYKDPISTFKTNIIGSANVFEACRGNSGVKVIINITSDKCYENKEWVWGYRENDPMGGYDPYSASKGCAELITNAYRNSFFPVKQYKVLHQTLIASVRAGNVIGGGDWAEDRLIPDIIKATSQNQKLIIRNPYATRPWQHVLESLSGYLHLGMKLLNGEKEFTGSWNFGPKNEKSIAVKEVVSQIEHYWKKLDIHFEENTEDFHEANLLKLDCSKAHTSLKWNGIWNYEKTLKRTIEWYKQYYENGKLLSIDDINTYVADARESKMDWALSESEIF